MKKRKELTVGEVAYTLKGKAFKVVEQDAYVSKCDNCGRLEDRCSAVLCQSCQRSDGINVRFERYPRLDRKKPVLGVFATPTGKRWEVVEFSGECTDCALFQKPDCDKFNCYDTGPVGEYRVAIKRRKDLEKA